MRPGLLAFALGVWLLQQQSVLPAVYWLWLLPLALTPLLPPRSDIPSRQLSQKILVILSCLALGYAWAGWRAHLRMAESLPYSWQGVDIRVQGVVSGLPDRDADGERFDFRVEKVLTSGASVPENIRLSWHVLRDEPVARIPVRLKAGGRWQLTVRLKRPHGTSNPNGFDREAWLLERNIRATGTVVNKAGQIRLGVSNWPADRVQHLREVIRERIQAHLSGHSQAGVITALVVGDQNAIANEDWRTYNRTGTSHLVSISGLHITLFSTLVGGLAYLAWKRFPRLVTRLPARRAALMSGWLAALTYTLLAGFQIPAQRTLFMLSVLVAGFWIQRAPRPSSLLLAALFVVLLLDPWAVLAMGFWLSFGAIAAMMWATQGLAGTGGNITTWARTQAAVTIALAPVLLLLFHQISLVSPLANALAIPLVSMAVVPLALAGAVIPPMLSMAAWLMQWVESSLHWLAAFSWSSWALPEPSIFAVVFAALGVAWLLFPGAPSRWLGGCMFLPLLFPHIDKPGTGAFEAEVLDVGQGTAVIIRTNKHALLYDTGPGLGDTDASQQVVLPRLRALGIGKLDGLILTHDDSDHTGGAASVLRDADSGWLLSSLPPSHALLQYQYAIRCQRGQNWEWDGVRFEILNPPDYAYTQSSRSDNNKGCVLKISHAGQSLLLTADAERIGELEMTESVAGKLQSTVLMAGHHGSRTSSIPEFVKLVGPQHVVYSCGWRNRFGHPHYSVLNRFREQGTVSHRTDYQGWIRMTFNEAGVRFEHWREQRLRYWQAGVVE